MSPGLITPSDSVEPSSSEVVPSKASGDDRATPLSERVERARDTITDSQLYGTLKDVSERVGEKLGAVWQFSKKASWVLGTSALILLLPVLWEIDREQCVTGTTPNASTSTADSGAGTSGGASASTTNSASASTSTTAATAPAS